ncbi:MAG: cytochrome c biogenesis protein CcsA [Planctomyces sp.]|nr:cytochrome c biogenesis protein CcsA [Planctomyces sp.]
MSDGNSQSAETPRRDEPAPRSLAALLLEPLASLKLTVVLFLLAIFIVLAGTLAQVNADVWDVVDDYFRIHPRQLQGSPREAAGAFFVRIPSQIFFPSAFFPSRPTERVNFEVPKGWKTVETGAFQRVSLEADGGDAGKLAVSISSVGGTVLENINRWNSQIGRAPMTEDELRAGFVPIKIGRHDGRAISLTADQETILGAVLERPGETWYFKGRGPTELAERERSNFDAFVQSFSQPCWPAIWFPKGWVIGGLMLLNLLAAHLVRFRLQARGMRLVVGLWLLAVGCLVTWLVVVSGNNQDGFQTETLISYRRLWDLLTFGLFGLACGCTWLAVGTPPQHRGERWMSILAAAGLFGMAAVSVLWGSAVWSDDSSMRILYQLVKGTIAGVVLLAGCLVLFQRRAGIVLLHGGIALLMISEVFVGVRAVESNMFLQEGDERSYVFDTRSPELAVIDRSQPEEDIETVVPTVRLKTEGAEVAHELLPFDLEVVQYLQNAEMLRAAPDPSTNLATRGIGLERQMRPIASSTGVDTSGRVDSPALFVRLKEKATGEDLGVWLTWVHADPQTVSVNGRDYEIELRYGRTYLPYKLKLLDVRKDDYVGTNTPRNYSSSVLLTDETTNTRQELTIWMNNPLRYRGLTFYQSGYQRDERTGRESTTLQVVDNAGWMIPYVSCMIVGVGMCYQFVLTLLRFLNRWSRTPPGTGGTVAPPAGKATRRRAESLTEAERSAWARWLPLAISLLAAAWVLSKARPPRVSSGEMNLQAFGALPLAYEGRVKPFDSLARNTLLILSGKQEYRDDKDQRQPAIRWLLDVISGNPAGRDTRVFRITNLEVLKLLKLEPRAGFVYSLNEVIAELPAFRREAEAASATPSESLTLYQRGLRDLSRNLSMYEMLFVAFEPVLPELPSDAELEAGAEQARARALDEMRRAVSRAQQIEESQVPLAVPIPGDDKSPEAATTGEWKPLSTSILRAFLQRQLASGEPPEQTLMLQRILMAYRDGNVGVFNDRVAEYRNWLSRQRLPHLDLQAVRFETFFNGFAPFYLSMVLCVGVFLLTAGSWLGFSEPLRRSAFWLMALTFALHTFALIARMYISGRPPVTNLYTTGIFIGWAGVLFGLAFEWFYRMGVGNALASMAGFSALGISHMLALGGGDTFTVLQAVLDTQFWLATHVVTINLGYAATAVAGLLGTIYCVYRVAVAKPDPAILKAVTRMTYGSLCFAILFSFVGTVLGGLWADDSWGRFWGWDPKENGALIIVLWNCLVLHARWDGMIRNRGLAVLSVLGIIAVSWSWFGTNQLGAGLHAYGFTDAARIGLFLTWGASLALALLGLIPREGLEGE